MRHGTFENRNMRQATLIIRAVINLTALKNPNVKAIVFYEPGSGFIFSEDEVSDPIENPAGPMQADDILNPFSVFRFKQYGDRRPDVGLVRG